MPLYRLDGPKPRIHPTTFIHPDAVLIGDVTVGAQSSVWGGAVLRADFGHIRIGDRTSIQDGTVLHTTEEWPTVVGDECVVGHNTHLEGCTVEDRCLIGSGSVTLNRAVIRRGSIVGAQALIPEGFEVPSGSMALGVPAKIRGSVDNTSWIDYGVGEYLETAQRYRQQLTAVSLDDCLTDPDQGAKL
ncbi:MAG: gamma carbonic anhydrase family protein [Mycobacteriaceae bacterium]